MGEVVVNVCEPVPSLRGERIKDSAPMGMTSRRDAMISKETQYRIYAGTSKDDYTGWTRAELPEGEKDMEYWTLDLGDGYCLDRVTRKARGFFKEKTVQINSLRRDRSVEDPDGDYKDMNFSMLFNVRIMVSPDAIKFDAGKNSFAVLSREPADWEGFSENVPKFDDKEIEESNWASFYS